MRFLAVYIPCAVWPSKPKGPYMQTYTLIEKSLAFFRTLPSEKWSLHHKVDYSTIKPPLCGIFNDEEIVCAMRAPLQGYAGRLLIPWPIRKGPVCLADSVRKNSHIRKCEDRLYRPRQIGHQGPPLAFQRAWDRKEGSDCSTCWDVLWPKSTMSRYVKFIHAQVGGSLWPWNMPNHQNLMPHLLRKHEIMPVCWIVCQHPHKRWFVKLKLRQGTTKVLMMKISKPQDLLNCKLKLTSWKHNWNMNMLRITIVFHIMWNQMKSKSIRQRWSMLLSGLVCIMPTWI